MLKIKESELQEILEDVSAQLAKAFEAGKDKLVKAAPPEETPGEEASAPAEGSEAPPPEASGSPAGPGPEAPPADAAAPGAEPSADPAMDDGASEPLTPEVLQAKYAELAPEELDMHIKAALAAKAALAGGAPGADAGGMPPPVPPEASAPPMAPPAMKSEIAASPERGGKDSIDTLKSEISAKFDAMEALIKAQAETIKLQAEAFKSSQEDTENLTKALSQIINQPLRKAVTSVAHLPRVAEEKRPLDAAEVHRRLKTLAAKPDLKKADRQLINDFYDGRVKADALAPLFEDYK